MDLQSKSFEKSNELYEAALKEFGENGYEQASLNNILKVAGISKGTFYYHFKNKEEIYVYLMKLLIKKKKEFFMQNVTENILEKDFFEILENLMELGLKFGTLNPSINKFSEQFLKDRNSTTIKNILEKINMEVESSGFLDSFIERSYHKKEIREDIPKEFIKKIVNYLLVHLTDFTDVSNVEEVKPIVRYLIMFMKDGIKKN